MQRSVLRADFVFAFVMIMQSTIRNMGRVLYRSDGFVFCLQPLQQQILND